jgi:hypothetical protein
MRYLIPAVALIGLVVLALTPVPVIWGLLLAVVCLLLIVGVTLTRWIDSALLSMLRRRSATPRPRRQTHGISGLARRPKPKAAA